MADSTRLIDAVHDMRSAVSSACYRVDSIAMLLHEVGMEKLSDRLMDAVSPLIECSKRLSEAHGDKLVEDLNYSQDMTGNLLMMALKAATGEAK